MAVEHASEPKAYAEKVTAQVEQAKTKLHELEAYYKGKKAESEMGAIRGLKAVHDEIVRKNAELATLAGKTSAEAKVAQMKAEIESKVANLNAKLAELSGKANATKAG
jgi:conjugal transfer/entry exclusion protein